MKPVGLGVFLAFTTVAQTGGLMRTWRRSGRGAQAGGGNIGEDRIASFRDRAKPYRRRGEIRPGRRRTVADLHRGTWGAGAFAGGDRDRLLRLDRHERVLDLSAVNLNKVHRRSGSGPASPAWCRKGCPMYKTWYAVLPLCCIVTAPNLARRAPFSPLPPPTPAPNIHSRICHQRPSGFVSGNRQQGSTRWCAVE